MLGGEDHTKPYYSTVKSSSEGELSSEDEVKPDVLEKVSNFYLLNLASINRQTFFLPAVWCG
jgi:hypothetical protein